MNNLDIFQQDIGSDASTVRNKKRSKKLMTVLVAVVKMKKLKVLKYIHYTRMVVGLEVYDVN